MFEECCGPAFFSSLFLQTVAGLGGTLPAMIRPRAEACAATAYQLLSLPELSLFKACLSYTVDALVSVDKCSLCVFSGLDRNRYCTIDRSRTEGCPLNGFLVKSEAWHNDGARSMSISRLVGKRGLTMEAITPKIIFMEFELEIMASVPRKLGQLSVRSLKPEPTLMSVLLMLQATDTLSLAYAIGALLKKALVAVERA